MEGWIHSPRLGRKSYDGEFETDPRLTQLRDEAHQRNPEEETWDMDDHKITLKKLLRRYRSNINSGLTARQIAVNRELYGANVLTPPPKPSELWRFLKCITLGLNLLIWICAFLSLALYIIQYFHYWRDHITNDHLLFAIALAVVCMVSGTSFYYQEYTSDRIVESFSQMAPRFAMVKRNGRLTEVNVQSLVCGDIVEVKYGEIVPADIRIIECHEFHVDNSTLTGETDPQRRLSVFTDDDPMETRNLAFFSTSAIEGHAKGIVIRVGSSTMMGKMANVASRLPKAQSPLSVEMNKLITVMTVRSLLFGGTFFVIAKTMGYLWLESTFFLIGIIVANIPEGLSLTFTMILSLTAHKMAKKNVLVKTLQSVETLGSVSCICSDKTGTLTQNKMNVAHMWFNDQIAEADTCQFLTGESFDIYDPGFMALARVAALCSRARFKPGQEDIPIKKRVVDGDGTETALLRMLEADLGDVEKYRKNYIKLCEIPFNYRTKYQVFVYDLRNANVPRHFVAVKGAPERILKLCTKILIKNVEYDLNETWLNKVEKVIEDIGMKGERLIGFADCFLPREKYFRGYKFVPEKPEFLNAGLRFVGLMSMIDPPRVSAADAISKCRDAGIKVVMVTGDHASTAVAIAKSVGIISPDNETRRDKARRKGCDISDIHPMEIKAGVVTGNDLKNMSEEELMFVLKTYPEIVFARTNPDQKYTIVEALQKLGHIVAATGDGVNDTPALKKADIGISMGCTGTEVCNATADMVLLDDNFSSIVTGVEEGRLIFDNLKKSLQYNLTDNIAQMYSFFVFIILKCPLPMGTMAMLLTVLGTDVLPAVSIVYESAEPGIMKLKPRDPKQKKLLTPQLLSYTYGQLAALEVAAGFFTYFVAMAYNGFLPIKLIYIKSQWDSRAINDLEDSFGQEWTYTARKLLEANCQTSFFVAIVIMQVANVLCCKSRRQSIFSKKKINWIMYCAIIFELFLAGFFVYNPFFAEDMGLQTLKFSEWFPPIPFALLLIFYDELRRLGVRRWKDGWLKNELQI